MTPPTLSWCFLTQKSHPQSVEKFAGNGANRNDIVIFIPFQLWLPEPVNACHVSFLKHLTPHSRSAKRAFSWLALRLKRLNGFYNEPIPYRKIPVVRPATYHGASSLYAHVRTLMNENLAAIIASAAL